MGSGNAGRIFEKAMVCADRFWDSLYVCAGPSFNEVAVLQLSMLGEYLPNLTAAASTDQDDSMLRYIFCQIPRPGRGFSEPGPPQMDEQAGTIRKIKVSAPRRAPSS